MSAAPLPRRFRLSPDQQDREGAVVVMYVARVTARVHRASGSGRASGYERTVTTTQFGRIMVMIFRPAPVAVLRRGPTGGRYDRAWVREVGARRQARPAVRQTVIA